MCTVIYLMFTVSLTDTKRQKSEKAPLRRLNGSCQVTQYYGVGGETEGESLTHFPPHFRLPRVSGKGI
jgi:hypothetical protein